MPWIAAPDSSGAGHEQGWSCRIWAGADVFGQPVPLKVNRWRLDAGARAAGIPLGATEAVAYVIAGSGTAAAAPSGGDEPFTLGAESVLWLSACDGLAVEAGPGRLDLLVAQSVTPAGGFTPLRRAFAAGELPHLASTRDTRDRLGMVTDDTGVGARSIRADRIVYHPGDTAAATATTCSACWPGPACSTPTARHHAWRPG
jgi:hypothetical protein